MRLKSVKLILLLLLILLPVFAVSADDWYTDKKIEDVRFKGLKNITVSELESITSEYIGKNFTDETFWDLQGKLFALDYFDDLLPNAIPGNESLSKYDPENTVIIEFNVVERSVVKKIKITGNKNIRKNQLLDVILLKPGDLINNTKIKLDEDSIMSLYIEKGFPEVVVTGDKGEKDEDNESVVTFTIEEGEQTKISEIRFSGNSFASDSTLRKKLETKKQSLFSKGVYLESKIEEDIQNIVKYYGEKGFIDAEVSNVEKEVTADDEGNRTNLILTFHISEGRQYVYNGMLFDGNIIFTDDDLYEQVRLQEGDILNKTKLEADFSRVADLYYDDGYIFNVISKEEQRNETDGKISYKVKIIEQGRAHIENITIRGNDKTKDHVILRELPLEVGDVFSKKKIIEGMTNLYNLQFFGVVEPETPQGSVDGLMDLIINVEEGKTTDVQFGLSFTADAGELPIMTFVKWTDRNFLGNGQQLSIGTNLSSEKQDISIGFTEKWLADKRWTGGITLSVAHEKTKKVPQDILGPIFAGNDLDEGEVPDPYEGIMVDPDTGEISNASDAITDYEYAIRRGESIPESYLMEYDSWDVSLGLNTGYTWHTPVGRVNASTGYDLTRTWVDYDDEIYRPYNETVRYNFQEWQTINKLWYSLSWDTRDIIYNPNKGFFLKQSITYAGGILPSERNYISTTSKAEIFHTLFSIPVFSSWNFKMVLAGHTALSLLWKQFDGTFDVTRNDMFYIDGMTMARGWNRVYDGHALWDNWVELRMPIAERFLWWDWFLSATGIWADKDAFKDRDKNDYYYSLGGGFRLTVPGLPIGFYFVKRFEYENDQIVWHDGPLFDSSMKLDFVIGFSPSFY